ncbi:TraM recognition domain-containing protein [Acidovorax sp. FJL06]|uniref:TraM recognition domain-containing protein n=1 Tax=Acidovorax sp. FJL06 TaxID=2153365 RepID=UPI000F5871BD|nr:TraM recognition domain-containing protein [Acidovorax sp. FJL06]RQO80452.1 MFS transporter [Acidovorax sp. FJL06]
MLMKWLEWMWLFSGIPCGAAWVFMIDADRQEAEMKRQFWASIAVSGAALAGFWFIAEWFGKQPDTKYLIIFCASLAFGVWCGILFLRKVTPILEKFGQGFTKKTASERNKKTDVREINKHLPDAEKSFVPNKFFKDEGVFIGLDEHRKPIYLEQKTFPTMPHIQIVGTSGAGKGVALAVLGAQWIKKGEAVFFLDPKDDEWGPHTFADAARQAGSTHHYINLREKLPQFNLFDGASADEIEELFVAGFGLNDTGTAADFYSIADRKYAGIVAREIEADDLTAAQAYERNAEVLDEHAPKIGGKLRELGEVLAANAAPGKGVSLARIIDEGGSCYVVGHMRTEKLVRLQKMILVRLLQIAEKRDRIGGALRPVAIVLDEAKYHLSRSSLEALGAARDKGVHVVVAHQSLADLRDVGGLDGDAVVGSVVENCKLKICYAVNDPVTAEWLARMSGTILVDDETRSVAKNVALTEKVRSDRSIRQAERYFVDENMMQNLPKKVCVIYGLGLAKFAHICNLTVQKSVENVKICAVKGAEIKKAEDLI